jgi:hypothetical protein
MRLPSPALVIACLALLLVASGVAYGAAKATNGSSSASRSAGGQKPAPPDHPFNFSSLSFADNFATVQFTPPTTATLAFTGFRVANATANGTTVTLIQYSETGGSCAATSTDRFLGQWSVPAGQTVEEQLTTPIVLAPLAADQSWCLITYASGSSGSGFYITYNGYLVKGTFAQPGASTVIPGATTPTR